MERIEVLRYVEILVQLSMGVEFLVLSLLYFDLPLFNFPFSFITGFRLAFPLGLYSLIVAMVTERLYKESEKKE